MDSEAVERELLQWVDALGYAVDNGAELSSCQMIVLRTRMIEAAGIMAQQRRLIEASHAVYAPADLPDNCTRFHPGQSRI